VKPITIARASVECMLQATREAAETGSTISAAIRRTPTMRIETATVSAASTATTALSSPIGAPATRAPSSSRTAAKSGRRSRPTVRSPATPSKVTSATSPRVTVRIEPNRYWNRLTSSLPASETRTTPSASPV
jgi:hypothetical protein